MSVNNRSENILFLLVKINLIRCVDPDKMSAYDAMLLNNIEVMNRLEGFNVVLVCCSNEKQAMYWQGRLEQGKGSVLPHDAIVVCVEEDWPGGAGNGKTSFIISLV